VRLWIGCQIVSDALRLRTCGYRIIVAKRSECISDVTAQRIDFVFRLFGKSKSFCNTKRLLQCTLMSAIFYILSKWCLYWAMVFDF